MASPKLITIFPQPRLPERVPIAVHEKMLFRDAAPLWLEWRKLHISPATQRDYQVYIRTLSDFFGLLALENIDSQHIREYQMLRGRSAGPSAVNHETSVLQQILKHVNRWQQITGFQPLPLPKESPGRCISEEEEARFFQHAFSRPGWCVAAWASLISINTTAGPGEILHLRLCDVDVDKRTMQVNALAAKNRERIRVLPLNDAALWAVRLFLERAKALRSTLPEHFLIPFPIHRKRYDPARPQAHYYRGFNEILAAAGLQFRPYDFRHTAITRMLEAGVPEETVIAMAGHVGRQMLKKYSHIRLEAKFRAVEALERNPPATVRRLLTKSAEVQHG